jgi:RNA polymerase primary sigma factor
MRQLKIGDRITALRSKSILTYFSEVSKIPLLSGEKEVQVAVKAQKGDKASIDLLVKSNLRFVVSVAKMYDNGKGKLLDDLIAAGNGGLLEAAHKFDPSRGFKFISFAVWYIRKEILKYLNDHGHITKIPITHKHIQRKAKEISGTFFAKEGRDPTEEELLEQVRGSLKNLKGLQIDVMKSAISVGESHTSLDAPAGEDSDLTVGDLIPSPDYQSEAENQVEINATLQNLLGCLTPLERSVIEKRYLFGASEHVEYSTIALEVGITPQAVQAAAERALRKLKHQATRVRSPFS